MEEISNKYILKEIKKEIQETKSLVNENSSSIKGLFEAIHEVTSAMGAYADTIDKRFDRMESQMVTKDYLDRKLSEKWGDSIELVDRKVKKHELNFHAA